MGRIDPSQGLAPPSIRKDIRAKQARHIINKTIPAILASNARARRGADSSELIADPAPYRAAVATSNSAVSRTEDADAAYVKRKGQGRRKIKEPGSSADGPMQESKSRNSRRSKSTTTAFLDQGVSNLTLHSNPEIPIPENQAKACSIRIISTDTLTATHFLSPSKVSHKGRQNICILNMASPLRPGGGVLSGATSQEEFLCARTTLLPSLKESYYRLPEFGGIWTSDVLVFRNARALGDGRGEMGVGERAWVDVISAGMLRFPELEVEVVGVEGVGGKQGGKDVEGETEVLKKLSPPDQILVEKKMRAVLRIAQANGVKKLVLGAWGCGAYGNPVGDIARAWKKVLTPTSESGKKGRGANTETWPNLEDVIFAISNRKMAAAFAQAFDPRIEVETGPGDTVDDLDEDDEEDNVAEELRAKIKEMEGQIRQVWNPDLKARMGVILEGLRAQLREREGADGDGDGEESGRVARRESDGEGDDSEEVEHDEDEDDDGEEDDGSVKCDDDDEDEIVQVPKR